MKTQLAAVALALGFFGTFAAGQAAAPAPAAPAPAVAPLTGPQVGQPAPDFALTTIDGKKVSLAAYRGKTLVLNVWATWCPPCRQETPDLLLSYAKLHAPNVEFLGVDDTEQAPIVRAFVADKNVPYPQAIDGTQTFSKAYDIQYFPTTFVIDPQGIVRARNIDVITPQMLQSFVADAQVGKNAEVTSPAQAKIDALLTAMPAFTGDPVQMVKDAKSANDAIDKAEDVANNSDPATGNWTDLLRTRVEEATLRDAAIVALTKVAQTDADKELLDRMRGDAARDREQWSDALTAYDAALALDPKDEDALGGVAMVAGSLKLHDRVIDADTRVLALHPDDWSSLLDLALAYSGAKDFDKAESTIAKAETVAIKEYTAKPADTHKIREVAATHLNAARIYAKAGDATKAHEQFDLLTQWALKLPKTNERYAMYLEFAQEGIVALNLTPENKVTSVSLAPWTGADLPGSTPNTIKYRLVVAGKAGKNVALHAAGVPKGWIASFCTDRVCAPFKVGVALPDSGVKVIEFQLVPPEANAKPPKVRVVGTEGGTVCSATT